MNDVLNINHTILKPTELILEIDSSSILGNMKPTGQMLVDSVGLSFVYLLENDDSYTYMKVPEIFWNDLKEALSCRISVSVTNGKEKIYLEQFLEELSYLIENIKGNSNYGEEMVKKIEATF
ncbi:UPF0738 family protein [Bacillus benzoevorans]|uniref:Uncharacterized protein n=1 Tax=Bacillus benzoevorans TaxID=1456 RepID=A0A7X0HMJ2_9BACI|nr:hypothetical protein [Bacillus benzoevorans]MBB6443557.1 hypothetical protein [Bacillus benzoevorans]